MKRRVKNSSILMQKSGTDMEHTPKSHLILLNSQIRSGGTGQCPDTKEKPLTPPGRWMKQCSQRSSPIQMNRMHGELQQQLSSVDEQYESVDSDPFGLEVRGRSSRAPLLYFFAGGHGDCFADTSIADKAEAGLGIAPANVSHAPRYVDRASLVAALVRGPCSPSPARGARRCKNAKKYEFICATSLTYSRSATTSVQR